MSDWFVDQMLELQATASEYFRRNIPSDDNPQQQEQFQLAENCSLCEKPSKSFFVDLEVLRKTFFKCCEDNPNHHANKSVNMSTTKVKDHGHITGKYRGAAGSKCNLSSSQETSNFVPIFFHNFSDYNCHLIFETLVTKAFELKLDIHTVP